MPSLRLITAGTIAGAASATSGSPAAVVATRGLRVALVAVKNNDVITTATAGWTKITQRNSGAGASVALFVASGTAGTPTFNWTNATAWAAQQFLFDNFQNDPVTAAVGAIALNDGTTALQQAPGITTAADGSFILGFHLASSTAAYSAVPAGWASLSDTTVAASAWRFAIIGQPAPDPITTGSADRTQSAGVAWVAGQVELQLVNGTTDSRTAELEIAPVGAPAGLRALELEIAPIIAPNRVETVEIELAPIIAPNRIEVVEIELAVLYGPGTPTPTGRRRQTYNN